MFSKELLQLRLKLSIALLRMSARTARVVVFNGNNLSEDCFVYYRGDLIVLRVPKSNNFIEVAFHKHAALRVIVNQIETIFNFSEESYGLEFAEPVMLTLQTLLDLGHDNNFKELRVFFGDEPVNLTYAAGVVTAYGTKGTGTKHCAEKVMHKVDLHNTRRLGGMSSFVLFK